MANLKIENGMIVREVIDHEPVDRDELDHRIAQLERNLANAIAERDEYDVLAESVTIEPAEK